SVSVRWKLDSQVAIAIAPARLTRNAEQVIATRPMWSTIERLASEPTGPSRRDSTGSIDRANARTAAGTTSDAPISNPNVDNEPFAFRERGRELRSHQQPPPPTMPSPPATAART